MMGGGLHDTINVGQSASSQRTNNPFTDEPQTQTACHKGTKCSLRLSIPPFANQYSCCDQKTRRANKCLCNIDTNMDTSNQKKFCRITFLLLLLFAFFFFRLREETESTHKKCRNEWNASTLQKPFFHFFHQNSTSIHTTKLSISSTLQRANDVCSRNWFSVRALTIVIGWQTNGLKC